MYPGKSFVVWVRPRIGAVVGTTLALVAAFWLGTKYEDGWRLRAVPPSDWVVPDKTQATPPKRSLDFSDLIPSCTQPIPNGAILDSRLPYQHGHILEINNGTDGDAIIKVRDAATGRLAESFFVGRGLKASVGNLPDGQYQIQYAFGDRLAQDCRSFVKTSARSQFPGIKTLVTQPTDDGELLTSLEYTLYAVPNGNVQPQPISQQAFDAN